MPSEANATAADPVGAISSAVLSAAAELGGEGAASGAKLDRPPKPEFGDYSSNAPMLLARYTRLELVEVREDQSVEGRIPERAFVVLLAADGDSHDSVGFSRWLEQRRQSGRDLCFVIGGPRGLDLDACDMKLSLGRMTLPHQLARVVLLEQIYRANKILAGEPYHY